MTTFELTLVQSGVSKTWEAHLMILPAKQLVNRAERVLNVDGGLRGAVHEG